MRKAKFWVVMVVTLFAITTICACSSDDNESDNSGGTSGSGYAEMDGHRNDYLYAYFSGLETSYEKAIWFTNKPIQEQLNNRSSDLSTFRLWFFSSNKDFVNFSSASIPEGTLTEGIALEYVPIEKKKDGHLDIWYGAGEIVKPASATVTITKTGTNKYRIISKNQEYLVGENGKGIGYDGMGRTDNRKVIGNFEWEGTIVDARSVIPAEYWDDDDD